MATLAVPLAGGKSVASQLKTNTLNLFDSTVIATSSVAPAYSIAATAGLLVAAVGFASPAAILVSFFPVVFIALAYYYLNSKDPNCGASYAWISRTLSPYLGWMSGWVQVAANILFCGAAPLLAGANTLALLNNIFPGQISATAAGDTRLIAVVGVAWLAFVTVIVVRGIRLTANFQWVMVAIEYLVVVGFAVAAFVKLATAHVHGSTNVSGSWFNPFSLQGVDGLAAGAVLGVFFFWGWDTAANVNEETKDATKSPGRAGIISMFILLFIFLLTASAMQAYLPQHTLINQGGQALFFFASSLAPHPLDYLMVLAVLSSTVAVVQTTLLPSSRLTFSMARDGVFPKVFGHIHPTWKTPWAGTLISALIAGVFIAMTTLNSSINTTFANIISNIGVLVAFYYGVTGIACAWAFRKVVFKSARVFVFAGVLPLLGGLFLFWIAYQVVKQAGIGSSLPVLVTIGIGIPLLLATWYFNRTGFFQQKLVAYTNVGGELIAAPAGEPSAELVGSAQQVPDLVVPADRR